MTWHVCGIPSTRSGRNHKPIVLVRDDVWGRIVALEDNRQSFQRTDRSDGAPEGLHRSVVHYRAPGEVVGATAEAKRRHAVDLDEDVRCGRLPSL